MKTNPDTVNEKKAGEITSLSVLGARLTWAALGPLVLLVMAGAVFSKAHSWFSALDVAYGVVVALMILARWVEQRSGSATTLTGEPATSRHFARYVAVLLPLAIVVWVVAHLFQKS